MHCVKCTQVSAIQYKLNLCGESKMSNNLSSPTINRAIGKLVKKYGDASLWSETAVEQTVVQVLDCLGYLGVLDYSRFNPDLLEQSLNIGNFTLEVETISKDEN